MEIIILVTINIVTLIAVIFLINRGFVDKYNWYFTIFYWGSLILGSIFIFRQYGIDGFIFPIGSFFLFICIVLTTECRNDKKSI